MFGQTEDTAQCAGEIRSNSKRIAEKLAYAQTEQEKCARPSLKDSCLSFIEHNANNQRKAKKAERLIELLNKNPEINEILELIGITHIPF